MWTLLLLACAPAPTSLDAEPDDKIYGGSPPDVPADAAVVLISDLVRHSLCTGTLVGTQVVLTAAHCVTTGTTATPAPNLGVHFGDDSSASTWGDADHAYDVVEVHVHPSWEPGRGVGDLALLRLDHAVPSSVAAPVGSLPGASGLTASDRGAVVQQVGFGRTEAGTVGRKLQVRLPIAGISATQVWYSQAGGGMCSGDSGGPDFLDRGGVTYVVGVHRAVSGTGDPCTGTGFSTRVDSQERWIDLFLWAYEGAWYTALSTGTSFGPYYSEWTAGHGRGSDRQLLGDVDGDGRDDAIVFFNAHGSADFDGAWYVALSYGSGFGGYSHWTSGHGTGSDTQLLADVDGDGRADAVAFFNEHGSADLDGAWYVARSNGAGFDGYALWARGHGTGSDAQLLADVDGDGRADAVAFFNDHGSADLDGAWYVARSNGAGFDGYTLWARGHGRGSDRQLVGDVDGDGRADAVSFFNEHGSAAFDGAWYVARSTGSAFTGGGAWVLGHGTSSDAQLLADADGDGRCDALAFFNHRGSAAFDGAWYVAPSTGSAFVGASAWIEGHGTGSDTQLAGDGDGDGRADSVVFFNGG